MDPVTIMIVPGVLGGLVIAWIIRFLEHRRYSAPVVGAPQPRDSLSPDVINIARVKVAGVGGLGLVAMAATVALELPRVWQTISTGFVLGSALAIVLIVRRRGQRADPGRIFLVRW